MSSIERAIDKLGGNASDSKPEGSETMQPVDFESVVPEESEADSAESPAGASTDAFLGPTEQHHGTRQHEVRREGSPHIRLEDARLEAAGLLMPNQPRTREAEEYQRIKRRLLGNMVAGMHEIDRPANLILVTSSVPGEGKTFTTANLAISIAMEVDHTVLAIDVDSVKRDFSKIFKCSDRKGLFDVLADDSLTLADVLVNTSMPNLVLVPVGTHRDDATELLASNRMRDVAEEIAQRYSDRVVIFDTPPVMASTAAPALASYVGQVVFVAESGKTTQDTLREALHRLDGAYISGMVLNKAKPTAVLGYEYYGYYSPRE